MSGSWSEETVGTHPCDVYDPAERNAHGLAVIYLHGVHLNRLVDNGAFTEQFERHGLPVVAPMTQRSWWTDRICPEFDAEISAEQHLLRNVVPFVRERFGARERGIGRERKRVALDATRALLSYYSSHDGATSVYLARLRLE